jgi:purine-binding chemotaxis protein CheW
MSAIKEENLKLLSYLRFRIGSDQFGLDVKRVKDVLGCQKITQIPMSRDEVYGVLNLRGRIITVVDPRVSLGVEADPKGYTDEMYIVIEHGGEDYALIVDTVEDVVPYPAEKYPEAPRTLSKRWKKLSEGVDPRGDKILPILDVPELLDFVNQPTVQTS